MEIKKTQVSSFIHNYKKHQNTQRKQLTWSTSQRIHLNYYTSILHIPFKWNAVLIRNYKHYDLHMYSNKYLLSVPLPKTFQNIWFDSNASSFILCNMYENNFTKLYLYNLNQLLTLCNSPFYLKLKFKGKGYYIYKNYRTTITPQFGFAHRHYIYASYTNVKFRTKTSIMLFGTSHNDLMQIGREVKKLRSINIFTGRGVRFSKQIIYKKTGKVSSYR